jgi:hypothetical protein
LDISYLGMTALFVILNEVKNRLIKIVFQMLGNQHDKLKLKIEKENFIGVEFPITVLSSLKSNVLLLFVSPYTVMISFSFASSNASTFEINELVNS